MTHPAVSLASLYPNALALIDYELGDNAGTFSLSGWNVAKLGPKPTIESLISFVPPEPPAIPPQPRWLEFGAVVMGLAEVKALVNQAVALGETPLAMGLAVGLGKAADGESRVFLGAWHQAVAGGLVPAELITQVQALAVAFDLPAEFIAGLAGGSQTG
jgi:hypothetical protein